MADENSNKRSAKIWRMSTLERDERYGNWLVDVLLNRNCHTVLDSACGSGIDSLLLIESGFQVVSSDVNCYAVNEALQERWRRRDEKGFDKWIIEEADWLTLQHDLDGVEGLPEGGFDAVLCVTNSLSYLPAVNGDMSQIRLALTNLMSFVRPGGYLIIDHRNFDEILATGKIPVSVQYKYKYPATVQPALFTSKGMVVNYQLNVDDWPPETRRLLKMKSDEQIFHFQLTLNPLKLNDITNVLKELFPTASSYEIHGDFKPLGEVPTPAYYMHIIQK